MNKDELTKVASVCASAYLKKGPISKEAASFRGVAIGAGLGLGGLLGGWAYHQNKLKDAYRRGNADLMAEMRPLIAGLRAPQGAYSLPGGNGFA